MSGNQSSGGRKKTASAGKNTKRKTDTQSRKTTERENRLWDEVLLVVLLVGLVMRLFPAFVMGAYIIKSTTASECITALGRMHIGRQITIPLSVLFRFIPTMQEESAAIKDAMRMREVQFGTKKFWQNPAALIEYRFIPLMISVVKIGDDLSAAALTRGLDNPVRRTNITKVGFTGWDLLTVLIA